MTARRGGKNAGTKCALTPVKMPPRARASSAAGQTQKNSRQAHALHAGQGEQ